MEHLGLMRLFFLSLRASGPLRENFPKTSGDQNTKKDPEVSFRVFSKKSTGDLET